MKTRSTRVTSAGLAVVVALLAWGAPEAITGQSAAIAAPGASSPDGMRVLGHWQLEIFESDGSLQRVYEFDNHLVDEGRTFLARFLGMQTGLVACPWRVLLFATPNNGEAAANIVQACGQASGDSDDLEVSVVPAVSGPPFVPAALRLVGSASFATDLDLAGAATSVTSDEPGTDLVSSFTAHPFDALIPISAGQSVRATVEIRFPPCDPCEPGANNNLTSEGSGLLPQLLAGQKTLTYWTMGVKPLAQVTWTGPIATASVLPDGLRLDWSNPAPSAAQLIGVETIVGLGDGSRTALLRRQFPYSGLPSVVEGQSIEIQTVITFN